MPRSRLLILVATSTAVSAAVLLGGVLVEGTAEQSAAGHATISAAADALGAGVPDTSTLGAIRRLESEAATSAGARPRTFTLLGLAYQQRARETADPT